MPTDPIKVVAQRDTFLRIARARPLTAIAELIWNSLDADATSVTVYFDENELGLRGIVVEDDGDGATPDEAREFFRRLGGSWKKPGSRTKKHGRVLHGSQGQGRYKALSVGRSIQWTYYYEQDGDIYEFALSILGDDPSEVRASDPKKSGRDRTGCIVRIQDPIRQFKNLDSEEAVLEITELFAIYLADYPGVRVSYAGQALDPKSAISNQFSLEVPEVKLAAGDSAGPGRLRVLEWRHLDRRSLFICDARGFALQQVSTRFQLKKHSFSAYLQSPYLDQLDQENRLDLAELDPLVSAVIEAAKDAIKAHYDAEGKREAARMIQEWKASKIYPYEDEPKNDVEAAERQVFEIVAVKVQTAHSELAGAPKLAKKLQLELLRHAIETGPNQLRELLAKVVDLPKREQDDLAKLLEHTTLSSIIGAAKVVTDRLSFLRGLYQIIYEYDETGRVKERTQLHRVLALNPWLFGEEFVVSTDDRDLTAVLKSHKKFLDEDIVIDDPVKHVDQKRGVVDLMLSRLLRRHRADEVEHLVVELKRPGVAVGQDEINQISKYAASIERDGRFATRDGVVWRYWVISDTLDEMGKWQVEQDQNGRGMIRDTPKSKIYVRTWDQLIEENKAKYQFIQERLNFSANDERAMSYLRGEYAALLDGVTVESDLNKVG
ncbi:ATP-binding protein [Caulobacter segnis]|uniref:ATP-binding protein n=1 Tax=Caulobacter segnis TaxID=88688 RepID=UPI00240FCF01|nr:ATP-binding protein [Caulobacter segnis]MDG2521352.1 ATP-binding protein [Caulobacter segnis]